MEFALFVSVMFNIGFAVVVAGLAMSRRDEQERADNLSQQLWHERDRANRTKAAITSELERFNP